jgi:hypothetical protein
VHCVIQMDISDSLLTSLVSQLVLTLSGRAATTLAKSTLNKTNSATLLPPDEHVAVSDLLKLFCKPAWTVRTARACVCVCVCCRECVLLCVLHGSLVRCQSDSVQARMLAKTRDMHEGVDTGAAPYDYSNPNDANNYCGPDVGAFRLR